MNLKNHILLLATFIFNWQITTAQTTTTEGSVVMFEAPPKSNTTQSVKISPNVRDEKFIFTTVEQNPEYVNNGVKGMYDFLKVNLVYPEKSRLANIYGKVFVKFIIEKDGSIGEDVQILKGISDDCNAEAIRLVKSFPKWKPGYQNGKAVRVYYVIPINFVIN